MFSTAVLYTFIMAIEGFKTPDAPLKSPHEELAFLRERLKELEQKIETGEHSPTGETSAHEVINEYKKQEPKEVLAKGYSMLKPEVEKLVLDLAPEEHDVKMAELLAILQQRGIRNALSIVEGLNNPHIEDDFHRFLAEYLKEGYPIKGLDESEPIWKGLSMTLFEVALPTITKDDKQSPKTLKELLSSMEQFYSGALAVAGEKNSKKNYFTLELAVEADSEDATLYICVPSERKELFEKQLLSIFPQAKLAENKNDYNVFNEEGETVASNAKLSRSIAYPIRTYESFDYDPLNITLSAFAKLAHKGEGAAIQILVRPGSDEYQKKFKDAIGRLQKGVSAKEALNIPMTFFGEVAKDVGKELKDLLFSGSKKDKDKKKEEPKIVDEIALEQVKNKISHPIVETNIRLLASGLSEMRAHAILSDLEATFNQFEEARGNKLIFERMAGGAKARFMRAFSFRLFRPDDIVALNLRELTTLFHLPPTGIDSSRELKRSKAGSAPAPVGMPTEGVLMGMNRYRNVETPIYFNKEDRVRHFYTIGQTGTGKTTLLKNMIIQDIQKGEGVCMIDPHGTDIVDVLACVPKERFNDVIYFDPSYTPRPMGLNMLEYDTAYPEQKTFVVNELFSIFKKLYGGVPESMGPMFEQYFRNATMLVIEDPVTGNTLFDVSRVMSDKDFRQLKLSRCNNPIVVQFWRDVAEKAGGDASLQNMVPYITSKFDVFLANDIMRPIVVQSTSAFNFRRIMDERKILLVNLAKGRLGDINAHLIGLIIVGKILMAALSRVDTLGQGKLHDFYLYIDEFQNITTDSIATILSEARKYRLSLNIAHQYIKQLDEKTKDAVFGNVGSVCSFRVGSEDGEYLEKQFLPVFSAADLMNVDNRNAFVRLLVNGRPERPFNIETVKPPQGEIAVIEYLKELSYQTYGKPREEIEEHIRSKYQL